MSLHHNNLHHSSRLFRRTMLTTFHSNCGVDINRI
jgi:hypothetical protein